MSPILLPRPVVNRILQQAQAHSEREVCGLIGARDGRPSRCYPVPNASPDAAHRFAMEPHAQIAALRALRENGESLFAIYHSHPDAPSRPSPRDIEGYAYPEAYQIIVSLSTKGVLEMRAFQVREGKVLEVPVELETMAE